MAECLRIEDVNAYEQDTLAGEFVESGLDASVAFEQQLRDPERPGAMDMWQALVDLADPTLLVVAAWILKTQRKVTRIKKPDGTILEHRQESFVGVKAADVFSALKAELSHSSG
jgi:hypothetical protein